MAICLEASLLDLTCQTVTGLFICQVSGLWQWRMEKASHGRPGDSGDVSLTLCGIGRLQWKLSSCCVAPLLLERLYECVNTDCMLCSSGSVMKPGRTLKQHWLGFRNMPAPERMGLVRPAYLCVTVVNKLCCQLFLNPVGFFFWNKLLVIVRQPAQSFLCTHPFEITSDGHLCVKLILIKVVL